MHRLFTVYICLLFPLLLLHLLQLLFLLFLLLLLQPSTQIKRSNARNKMHVTFFRGGGMGESSESWGASEGGKLNEHAACGNTKIFCTPPQGDVNKFSS